MPTVLLMLKSPVEGEVKTRLGQVVGHRVATLAYRRLVEHQMRQIPPGWRIEICFAPASSAAVWRPWLGDSCHYFPQADGDLGHRLSVAVDDHFRRSSDPVIVLGGDCPYLIADRLREAAEALMDADAALVPAADGGYCLIGLRAPQPHLFYAITWSTATVLAETRERLRERGLRWVESAALEDVDDAASWARAVQAFPDLVLSPG